MTVLEERSCALARLTDCEGAIFAVPVSGGGVRYVCEGHELEIFQIAWK